MGSRYLYHLTFIFFKFTLKTLYFENCIGDATKHFLKKKWLFLYQNNMSVFFK